MEEERRSRRLRKTEKKASREIRAVPSSGEAIQRLTLRRVKFIRWLRTNFRARLSGIESPPFCASPMGRCEGIPGHGCTRIKNTLADFYECVNRGFDDTGANLSVIQLWLLAGLESSCRAYVLLRGLFR